MITNSTLKMLLEDGTITEEQAEKSQEEIDLREYGYATDILHAALCKKAHPRECDYYIHEDKDKVKWINWYLALDKMVPLELNNYLHKYLSDLRLQPQEQLVRYAFCHAIVSGELVEPQLPHALPSSTSHVEAEDSPASDPAALPDPG